ncbi:hypoxanthine-DNA glycosylase [Gracilibacillus halotolerans]|uniref:Hypoxanthine-DNA glycosylase n=1 Tax=Gracilibacillus halotolerans TaxID=74386 RepID=A0A841RPK8_9BACI|nr:DNA-deoxyinosine glycosylase [Gracilibacillus halotolerans]MBB6513797.1 hypoxanthine-DNA glycosylase [Gracilibacillus halotolerans]
MSKEKKYSLAPIIGADAKVLILGSMPGEVSLRTQQYYHNRRNHFWKIIFTILNEQYTDDYETRKAIVKKHKIALWDVIKECERVGSLDSKIKNEIPNDFENLLSKHPTIKLIVLNGTKAYSVFKKYAANKVNPEIEVVKLPSTSPTPGRNVKSYEEKLRDWSLIKTYLND